MGFQSAMHVEHVSPGMLLREPGSGPSRDDLTVVSKLVDTDGTVVLVVDRNGKQYAKQYSIGDVVFRCVT